MTEEAILQWAREWEAAHPDALGWIGNYDRVAFEKSFFGSLRRSKRIRADTTDGHGHPLYHVHPTNEETT